jgi:carbon monoxide dehydrogenase subunit G
MKLSHTFTVAAPPDRVWVVLMDIPAMAECIPGVSGVSQADDTTYDAQVTTKIGPITARFACRIAVLSLDDATHTGRVEVTGKDVKLGGGVKAKMAMALAPAGDGTTVTIDSDVDIMGKIGQYGHGMISKRADAMLADFGVIEA